MQQVNVLKTAIMVMVRNFDIRSGTCHFIGIHSNVNHKQK